MSCASAQQVWQCTTFVNLLHNSEVDLWGFMKMFKVILRIDEIELFVLAIVGRLKCYGNNFLFTNIMDFPSQILSRVKNIWIPYYDMVMLIVVDDLIFIMVMLFKLRKKYYVLIS